MMLCIRVGYEQIVSSLIHNGANVNEAYDGETALHVAAAAGKFISIYCCWCLHSFRFKQ